MSSGSRGWVRECEPISIPASRSARSSGQVSTGRATSPSLAGSRSRCSASAPSQLETTKKVAVMPRARSSGSTAVTASAVPSSKVSTIGRAGSGRARSSWSSTACSETVWKPAAASASSWAASCAGVVSWRLGSSTTAW